MEIKNRGLGGLGHAEDRRIAQDTKQGGQEKNTLLSTYLLCSRSSTYLVLRLERED